MDRSLFESPDSSSLKAPHPSDSKGVIQHSETTALGFVLCARGQIHTVSGQKPLGVIFSQQRPELWS